MMLEIPDNATNGEMIQLIFPGLRVTELVDYVMVMGENYEFNNAYPFGWWNSTFKVPVIEKEIVS